MLIKAVSQLSSSHDFYSFFGSVSILCSISGIGEVKE